MSRRDPPAHAGHLDLLPFVRRVFRHRMTDARLQTVETELLGMERHDDVDGWEIPGRYLDFLRDGLADPLIEVVRHNDEDVRSLARLLAHVDAGFGDAGRAAHGAPRATSPASPGRSAASGGSTRRSTASRRRPWLAPATGDRRRGRGSQRAAAAATRPTSRGGLRPAGRTSAADRGRPATTPPAVLLASPWTEERIQIERARVLRRLGRFEEAAAAWEALGAGIGPFAPLAWIEVAKLREHRLGDIDGAIAAVDRAAAVLHRRRALGRLPEPRIESQLRRSPVATGRPGRGRGPAGRTRRSRGGDHGGGPGSAGRLTARRTRRVGTSLTRSLPDHGELRHAEETGRLDDERGGRRGDPEAGADRAATRQLGMRGRGSERGQEHVAGPRRVDRPGGLDRRPAAHGPLAARLDGDREATGRAVGQEDRRPGLDEARQDVESGARVPGRSRSRR